jgi:hypothetical protein
MANTVSKERKNIRQNRRRDSFSDKFSRILDDTTLSAKEKQVQLYQLCYPEVLRYKENAKKYLEKAGIDEDGYYTDIKYVRVACGTAYSGLLIALDCFLVTKGVKLKDSTARDIHFYRTAINKQNRRLTKSLNTAYEVLHLWGYYDGITKSTILKEGFKELDVFIDLIKSS